MGSWVSWLTLTFATDALGELVQQGVTLRQLAGVAGADHAHEDRVTAALGNRLAQLQCGEGPPAALRERPQVGLGSVAGSGIASKVLEPSFAEQLHQSAVANGIHVSEAGVGDEPDSPGALLLPTAQSLAPTEDVLESLRTEYEHQVVGRVEIGPDAMGWCVVMFPTCNGPLNVPCHCLTRVR